MTRKHNKNQENKLKRLGGMQRKVLLLLTAGLALGLTRSPKKNWWILKQIPKEWEKINRQTLERAINSLYVSRLVQEKHNKDGTTTMIVNENGKQRVLRFNLEKIKIKKIERWDKKWRIVMFDIPERFKKIREALRFHFKEMGMTELQKSVLISPYPCAKEIEFVLEFYNAKKYVRFILADKIDNDSHLRKKFGLV
ncbi:hypothetical protein COU49_00620 [Candidatus Nomurabacteria bacterium CG10_big_fil_rev_8_21_14_0_10_35_16]|uniref:Transcriptional repressor PaaX-like central Cas2-like domain-containing protein n=1 Tax=Candidatus Nomurabacteria bacterium CG10_big_fil_rev_8_21_14_0_10_35_16 TaxID=1974731 RepID=A0A2H0TC08_9BACT|nr:MAG: hypothetical protein COU49_00620 [Candidatus Nomurabacteria bacterium CG10_big_fil_rev_8_21_14_0_10_35_16]